MGDQENMTDAQLLRWAFASQIKAGMILMAKNPTIAFLWLVAVYAGRLGYVTGSEIGDAGQHYGKYHAILSASEAARLTLESGLYWLTSLVAAGFALVLTNLKKTIRLLSESRS